MTQGNVESFLSSVYEQLQKMENKNASVVQTINNQVKYNIRIYILSILQSVGSVQFMYHIVQYCVELPVEFPLSKLLYLK